LPELICDTSALIALHQIGQLDILRSLSTAVVIPAAVEQELAIGGSIGHDMPEIASLGWIAVKSPAQTPVLPNASDLGPGESHVLWLTQESSGSVAVVDDEAARRVAAQLGLAYTGTLGLLVDAKRAGLIAAVGPFLDELDLHRFRMSNQVREIVLRAAGEAP
jgi:uncharacterized protein